MRKYFIDMTVRELMHQSKVQKMPFGFIEGEGRLSITSDWIIGCLRASSVRKFFGGSA